MNNSGRRNRMICRALGLLLAAVLMARGVQATETGETTAGTQAQEIPQTTEAAQTEKENRPYTKAAPFMPVAAASTAAVMTLDLADEPSPNAAENGLILSKSATYEESTDSALIQLEAYVTGTVTTETVEKEIPCDIVIAGSACNRQFDSGVVPDAYGHIRSVCIVGQQPDHF